MSTLAPLFTELQYRATTAAADTMYVALPSLDGFKNTIITLAGTALIIVLVIRMFTAYAKKQWGELVGELIAVIFVGWFVWDTDGAIATLKEISTSIFG